MEGKTRMPLATKDGWNPAEVGKLLYDQRLSAMAKLLTWYLGVWTEGVQIPQEELSSVLSTNSGSTAVRRAIEDAERFGYIEVDRSVKPYRYKVQ